MADVKNRNLFARALPIALLVMGSIPADAASQSSFAAKNEMVVSAQQRATRVGVDFPRDGGHTFDAALAVGCSLAGVYQAASNMGDGGFMTIQRADDRKTLVDSRETSPLATMADGCPDNDGNVVKGARTTGHSPVGVPRTVSALESAREKFGATKRAMWNVPAVAYSQSSYVLDQAGGKHAAKIQQPTASEPSNGDSGRCAHAGWEAGREQPPSRGESTAPPFGLCARPMGARG